MALGNILQLLGVGAGRTASAMQMQQPAQQPFNVQPDIVGLTQVPQLNVAPAAPQRERRSLLGTVGGIADVIARVGGAEALYQPTLDANEARDNMRADRTRAIDLEGLNRQILEQRIGAGEREATGEENAMVAPAIRGLQAIQRGGGDISAAWPQLAQQAGIDPERAAELGQLFAANPDNIEGIAAMFNQGGDAEFGMQPFYAQDGEGNLRAYQLNRQGGVREIQLGEGQQPVDPLRFVDVGDRTVGVGERSGEIRTTLGRGERPGAVETREQRGEIAGADRASRERMNDADNVSTEARGAGGRRGAAAANPREGLQAARGMLTEFRGAFRRLRTAGGISDSETSTAGRAGALLSRNIPAAEELLFPERHSARQDIERLRTQAITTLVPLLSGMTIGGRNFDAARELELWRSSIASITDYDSATRALNMIDRRIREIEAQADEPAPARPAAPRRNGNSPAPRRDNTPPRRNGQPARPAAPRRPSVSNW